MESIGDFSWASAMPQFREKLLKYEDKQHELIEILKRSGINVPEKKSGEKINDGIDPFTFIGATLKLKSPRFDRVKKVFELLGVEPLPTGGNGRPFMDGRRPQTWAWFIPDSENRYENIKKLWTFFKKMHEENVSEEDFGELFNITSGSSKITSGLFCLFPERFLPIDKNVENWLHAKGIDPKFNKSFGAYENILKKIRELDNRPFAQISHEAYGLRRVNSFPNSSTGTATGRIPKSIQGEEYSNEGMKIRWK